MNCLCCGKPILENSSEQEFHDQWHAHCIKDFFNTETLPLLDLSDHQLELLAQKSVNEGFTVPGVQKKISVHLSKDPIPRLTLVDYPSGYILKPQSANFASLPEFEHTAMRIAQKAGIKTVPFALLKDEKQGNMFITRRIDRHGDKKAAMEDFCQLSGRLTVDKYRGSYERSAEIVNRWVRKKGINLNNYFSLIFVSWLLGNSDLHLKNFSLIEDKPGNRQYQLSPAYDILPVNLVFPSDLEETALTINGKKKNIRKKDFLALAASLKISETIALRIMKRIVKGKENYFQLIDESMLNDEQKESWKKLITDRADRLGLIETSDQLSPK